MLFSTSCYESFLLISAPGALGYKRILNPLMQQSVLICLFRNRSLFEGISLIIKRESFMMIECQRVYRINIDREFSKVNLKEIFKGFIQHLYDL